TPGSMNVKIEGKNVHLLGEPMLNNCGPGGSPPNTGATMMGFDTDDLELADLVRRLCEDMCEHEESAQAGETRRRSDDLEKQLRHSKQYEGELLFRKSYKLFPSIAWMRRRTKPDAITTDGKHCFDFKLCGDDSREDQVERQTEVASGNAPIII